MRKRFMALVMCLSVIFSFSTICTAHQWTPPAPRQNVQGAEGSHEAEAVTATSIAERAARLADRHAATAHKAMRSGERERGLRWQAEGFCGPGGVPYSFDNSQQTASRMKAGVVSRPQLYTQRE